MTDRHAQRSWLISELERRDGAASVIGEIRCWFAGDAVAICIAESTEYITAAFMGCEGVPLGVKFMERRFWNRYWKPERRDAA